MRRLSAAMVVTAAVGATVFACASVAAAASGGTWGTARQVPGTGALNKGGTAALLHSVSCASAGNCGAGGYYTDGSGHQQAFVASETNSTWATAKQVPGSAALNTGGRAQINSVSCASAGNCSAGGLYTDGSGHTQAFVAGEVNGTWGAAQEAPGTAALNLGGTAAVDSVSCASAGNCGAGGYYTDGSVGQQAFVVDEVNGTWGAAQEVPGTAALNPGGGATVLSLACPSAGNCSAGGAYKDRSGHFHAFVAGEVNGTWGAAQEVPGTAALNAGGSAQLDSVSCASAGNCGAGGYYTDAAGHAQAFVASETGGTWGAAQEVPGTAALNKGGTARINSVSCASAGSCGAGGNYTDGSGHQQGFIVGAANGTWGTAREAPGTAALNKGGDGGLTAVSCASAGNCSAGGFYTDGSGSSQAFVAGEVSGTWGTAEEVPGIAALNKGGFASLQSLSCGSAEHCSAGGQYIDGSFHQQAFVVGET